MRTCVYSEVLNGSAALAGFGPDDLGTPEFTLFRTFHDRRLQVAWSALAWPELCRTEARYFRTIYDATATYAAGAEVLDVPTLTYCQALTAVPAGQAPTTGGVVNLAYWAPCQTSYATNYYDATAVYPLGSQVLEVTTDRYYQLFDPTTQAAGVPGTAWGLLTPFNRYVAYEQEGQTPIGEVLAAWDRDPRLTTKLTRLPFTLSNDGVQFPKLSHNQAQVWLQLRLRRPLLAGDVWDSAAVYASGRSCYFPDPVTGAGNFYVATATTTPGDSPDTAPESWSLIEIPYRFRQYLIAGGHADWLTSDGQTDKAGIAESYATALLELEADQLQRQQGQVNRFNFKS